MRATVLTDRSLTRHAGRFVWLSIDTESDKNAAFLAAYPWEAVPTFEVIEPKSRAVVYRWLGAVTGKQLVERFAEGERAIASTSGADADALYAKAGQLDAQGKAADAASGYEAALAASSASWPSRGRAAEALVYSLEKADRPEECARRAIDLAPSLPPGGSRANTVATGLSCALDGDEKAAWRAGAITTLERSVHEALAFDGLLSDDRAGLLSSLVDAREHQGDAAGKKAAALELLAFLEADAKKAPTADARAALDGYRVSASIAAGDPARALAPLQASEHDLPADYNPPARLANIYRELGRYDEALAASDRALAKVYGPRKLTVLDARATIYEKSGEQAGASATLRKALEYAETLPESQRPKRLVERIKKRYDALDQ